MSRKTLPKEMEVNGAYLMGIIDSIEEESVRPLREKYGLTNIEPDKWYSAQQVVDFHQDIAENGQLFDLVALGVSAVNRIQYPPGTDTLEKLLPMMTTMHQMGWRNGDPGTLNVKLVSPHHVHMVFENQPLPIDLVYGLCYGVVKRFTPDGSDIVVTQKQEGEQYIFDLKW